MTPAERLAAADQALDKAQHFLYGDGSGTEVGAITGAGFAMVAVAQATIAQAEMMGRLRA